MSLLQHLQTRALRSTCTFQREASGAQFLCLGSVRVPLNELAALVEQAAAAPDGCAHDDALSVRLVDDVLHLRTIGHAHRAQSELKRSELAARLSSNGSDGFVVDHKPDLGVGVLLAGSVIVGSQDVALSREILRAHSVTRILNVGAVDVRDAEIDAELGVERRFDPLLDVDEQELTNDFIERCDEFAARDTCTLVHCNAGVSRSVSVCVALLLRRGQCATVDDALQLVRSSGRPAAKPNAGFMKALKAFERSQ